MSFILDEMELGKRAACAIDNEQGGWGAWVSPEIFVINFNPVVLNADWNRDPITGFNPPPTRPRPVGVNPFIPGQRKPSLREAYETFSEAPGR